MEDRTQGVPWEFEATRRARRAYQSRRRRRMLLALAIVVAVAGLAGGAVWAWQLRKTDDIASQGATPHIPIPIISPLTSATAERLACRAPLTFEDPYRLWIGGDSLAGSLGPALGARTAKTGVVLPTFDSRVSSGLANPGFFDWPKHATDELERAHSEIVVFIIGTNDFSVPRSKPVDASGQPTWRKSYGALVEQTLGIFERGGRPVYWVGAPPLREDRKDAGVKQVNDVARSIVAFHHDATYIDAYRLFSDKDGKYTATLPDIDGKPVRVRTGDGIHFTRAGAEVLAEAVYTHLDARCRIDAQAVPGKRQPVRQTPGSGRSPGGGGGGPATTNPPTTKPTVTTTTSPPSTTTSSSTTSTSTTSTTSLVTTVPA